MSSNNSESVVALPVAAVEQQVAVAAESAAVGMSIDMVAEAVAIVDGKKNGKTTKMVSFSLSVHLFY